MNDATRLASALESTYRIERPLGAGGMATVYLATDLKHDREVALKVLRPELGAVLGAERFLLGRERQVHGFFDHKDTKTQRPPSCLCVFVVIAEVPGAAGR